MRFLYRCLEDRSWSDPLTYSSGKQLEKGAAVRPLSMKRATVDFHNHGPLFPFTMARCPHDQRLPDLGRTCEVARGF